MYCYNKALRLNSKNEKAKKGKRELENTLNYL
ncbi:hypothetical protein J3E07_000625 [Methanococcus voltae]|uniref:Uncharacterized protein n=1 Tax=Methanococcus voltae TaxID=2188 RepID=A0A8J7RDG2_METVO|nr:hypothetical protein [Methanococcus voltae]MBP2201227.1 hypothetical protein [Methanococcus voltae]